MAAHSQGRMPDFDPPQGQQAYRHRVYHIVRTIPPGRVMTYGSIAACIVPPKGTDILSYTKIGPRWVGYALANCPDDVPWHRVINAQGQISSRLGPGPYIQRQMLEEEGVIFDERNRIDLSIYGWNLGER